MIYRVRIRVSNFGAVDVIGEDGVTFIATCGYGEEAQKIAQHIVNLWNEK